MRATLCGLLAALALLATLPAPPVSADDHSVVTAQATAPPGVQYQVENDYNVNVLHLSDYTVTVDGVEYRLAYPSAGADLPIVGETRERPAVRGTTSNAHRKLNLRATPGYQLRT